MPKPGVLISQERERHDKFRPIILREDCRKIMDGMSQNEDYIFDFIFADPPFNIGQEYKGYEDNVSSPVFEELIIDTIVLSARLLKPSGLLALHGPDDLAAFYLSHAPRYGLRRISWVNWHYRFGQCGRSNWIDSRCHCIIFGKAGARRGAHTFNADAVLVDSDRKTQYNDPRIHDHENGGQRLPFTIWGVPSDGPNWGRIQGNNAERRPGHPNQLPVVYLSRLIKAYTNTGEFVLDPFCGSGTTAAVCQELGRHCVTVDISEENCKSAEERVTSLSLRNVTRERLGLERLR